MRHLKQNAWILAIAVLTGSLTLSGSKAAFGDTPIKTICDDLASRTAGSKQAPGQTPDFVSLRMKLKSKDTVPLRMEVSSTVTGAENSIADAFFGGSASVDLVVVPDGFSNFQYFKVPVDASCKRDDSQPIKAVFATGGEISVSLLDFLTGGTTAINPNLLRDEYNMVRAVAGFPDSPPPATVSTFADLQTLFHDVCVEVKATLMTPEGILEMREAGDIGILAGSVGQTMAVCVGDNPITKYFEGATEHPECSSDVMAAATADLDSLIPLIPVATIRADTSAETVVASVKLGNCEISETLNLSDCSAATPVATGCE